LTIFNAQIGAILRDDAIDRVAAGSADWQPFAVEAIRLVALTQSTLTTDDVWRVLGRSDDLEGRAMGAAMRTAAHRGYIVRTDRTEKSVRAVCHRRDLRVWESRIVQATLSLRERLAARRRGAV
jgi:hypothetical protein